MKKRLSLLLVLIMTLALLVPGFAYAEPSASSLYAESAVIFDLTDGDILYEKNADARMYPASTTKMLTAILVLENKSLDTEVTIDEDSDLVEGTSIDIKTGETYILKDLLYATMVQSGNDGATALAKAVSGSVSAFVKLMNDKLAEIGCENTHFTSPHGLHDEDHYSTAKDLAKIAFYCMNLSEKSDIFREIVSLDHYTFATSSGARTRTVNTTNWLINGDQTAHSVYIYGKPDHCKYDGTIGIKTGSTPEAGGCLVAGAKKGNSQFGAVILKSGTLERYVDAHVLLDYAFENFRTISVNKKGEDFGIVKVKHGEFNKVAVALSENINVTLPVEASDSVITTETVLYNSVKAPFEAGTKAGEVIVYESGTEIGRYDIKTVSGIEKGGILSVFGIEDAMAKWIGIIALVILIAFIILVIAYVIYMRRKTRLLKQRKEAILKKRKEEERRRKMNWDREYDEDRYR